MAFEEWKGEMHPCLAEKELVRPPGWDDDKFERAVRNEADVLEKMKQQRHPHFVKVVAYYEKDKKHFLLFPWAENGNLRDYWKAQTPDLGRHYLSWAFKQLIGLAEAIRSLHMDNCRHGDLKPENILCFGGRTGRLVIADVGWPRCTRTLRTCAAAPRRP